MYMRSSDAQLCCFQHQRASARVCVEAMTAACLTDQMKEGQLLTAEKLGRLGACLVLQVGPCALTGVGIRMKSGCARGVATGLPHS